MSYLLDTNQVSKLLDGHPAIVSSVAQSGLDQIAVSVIVVGELTYMAKHSRRVEENSAKVANLCKQVAVVDVDIETASIYGELKETFISRFGPRSGLKRMKFRFESFGIHDNDLWIAATAIQHQYVLVSSDKHLDRIRDIHDFELESWWRPGL